MLAFYNRYYAITQDGEIIHTQKDDRPDTASLRPVIWIEKSQD